MVREEATRLRLVKIGEIFAALAGYARSRYAMNLDPFWSRLQKILIDDEKFYSTLVDAKTQLDFMISLFWITVTFTMVWTVELIYLRRSLIVFLIIVIGGPVLSILCTELHCKTIAHLPTSVERQSIFISRRWRITIWDTRI